MTEFVVMNIENMDNDNNSSRAAIRQKFRQVQVELARKEDFGVNDHTIIVNSHLGEVLNFNDTVLAYDLVKGNVQEVEEFQGIDLQLPDVVIVKKTYPKYRKNRKSRLWKLKHFEDQEQEGQGDDEMKEENIPIDENDEDATETKRMQQKQKAKINNKKRKVRKTKTTTATGATQKDMDLFLQDIEEEPELRQQFNLYKDEDIIKELESKIGGLTLEDKDQKPIKIAKRKTEKGKESAKAAMENRNKNKLIEKSNMKQKQINEADDDSDWESAEEDAPFVQLGELLSNMKIACDDGDSDEENSEDENNEESKTHN